MSFGYDDWQRVVNWEGPALVNNPNVNWGTTGPIGPFYTGVWEAVSLLVTVASGILYLNISWNSTNALGSDMGSFSYLINATTTLRDVVTNAGPFINFRVAPSLPTPGVGSLIAFPRNGTSRYPKLSDNGLRGSQSAVALAAAAFTTINAVNVRTGSVLCSVKCDSANWSSVVQTIDQNNNVVFLAAFGPTSGSNNGSLVVPSFPGPLSMVTTNTGGGGITVSQAMVDVY